MKICNICKSKYDNAIPHYCKKCGRNLTNQMENTDVLLFLSNLFKVIGIIGLFICTYPLTSCAINPFCIDSSCIGEDYTIITWIIIFLPVLFIIIGILMRRYFKKICLLKINK